MYEAECPYCHHKIEAVRVGGEDRPPSEGAILFCERCFERSEFANVNGAIVAVPLEPSTKEDLDASQWFSDMHRFSVAIATRLQQKQQDRE